jgi:hypothetical protein
VPCTGEVPNLPAPDGEGGVLPSRLGMVHLEAVIDLLRDFERGLVRVVDEPRWSVRLLTGRCDS